MKTKNGKVKLEKGETRVGNFFFKAEKDHIKVQDLSTMISFRIARNVAAGMWLDAMLSKGDEGEDTLHIYAASLFALLLTVPDNEFVGGVNTLLDSAMRRHPEYYGIKPQNLSDDEQEKVVEEEREKAEFVEQVKNLSEDEGNQAR